MVDQGDGALVILPTFNERATLAGIVDRVLTQIPRAHVLVIDDGSPDGTGEIADELANDWRVRVIHREGKLGLGTAYLAGFQHAVSEGYRWAIEMDADGSHLQEQLPALLDAARAGVGLVIGARWIDGGRIENWPWYRVCISRIGTAVARGSLRSQLRDLTSGFRVIDTTWLKRVDLSEISSNGYGFQVESAWLLELAGCPVAEVPITFVERADGRSKMSLGIIFEALASVLTWGVRIRLTRREK